MRSRHSKQPILNGMRVWHLFFLLSLVAWSGSAALAGDLDCDEAPGSVLFRPHAPGHEPPGSSPHPPGGGGHDDDAVTQSVRVNLGTLVGLTGPSLSRVRLLVFDGCVQLPTLYRRRAVGEGALFYASRPTPIGPRAYLSISTERDALGNKRKVVFLAADLGRYAIEIAPAGNPPTGPIRDYVASRRNRLQASNLRADEDYRHQDLSGEPGMPSEKLMQSWWKRRRSFPSAWADSGRRIELVVGFTQDVIIAASSSMATIQNKAKIGVERFNDALHNSGIMCKVRIVGYTPTYIDESIFPAADLDDHLLAAAYTNTPLRTLRRDRKADLATMLVERGMDWGQGYVWKCRAQWFGYKAYSIVRWEHVASTEAVAHECAHNMGCGHELLGSLAQSRVAHGYFLPETGWGWCSVVARGPESMYCQPIQMFSSPDLTWTLTTGSVQPMGTSTFNHNVSVIRRNLHRVANWGNQISWITP